MSKSDWYETRWTFGAFDDGSSMWLVEWRNHRTYRCISDDGQVSKWFDSLKDYGGAWQDELSYISPEMAAAVQKRWALARKDTL
jgi:hypothetical protein